MSIKVKIILGSKELTNEDIKKYRISSKDVDKIINDVYDRMQSAFAERKAS